MSLNMMSANSKRGLAAPEIFAGRGEGKENLHPTTTTKGAPISNPTTPANPNSRLPLTHLIGQHPTRPHDDQADHAELQWKQSTPKNSQRTPGKKRKRAQSSSPPSVTTKVFKTPKPDPASEIWSNYNAHLNESAIKASQSGLEKLLIESSPRSSETAGSVGGLRRYASCGYQFPTSRKKKQRTRLVQHAPAQISEEDTAETTGISKVSLLLESVKRRQDKEQHTNSQSDDQDKEESPCDRPAILISRAPEEVESPLQRRGDQHAAKGKVIEIKAMVPQESMCEFDDFDIDDDDLDQLIASTNAPAEVTDDAEVHIQIPQDNFSRSSSNTFNDGVLSGNDWDQAEASIILQHAPVSHEAAVVKSASVHSTIIMQAPELDEFDEFDLEEFELEEAITNGNSSFSPKSSIQRYRIKAIHESEYVDDFGRSQPEKALTLEFEGSSSSKRVILRQSWFETPCTVDGYVHIIGQFNSQGVCIINNEMNMLILHPDHLVSATVVADSFGCIRRAVLQDRVKATSQASAPMLYGNLLHELFQEAMTQNVWDLETLEEVLMKIIPRHFETLVEIGMNVNQVREYLVPRLQEMALWAGIFVRKSPHSDALADSRNGAKSRISVNKLLDVEEHVWSPNYGLKGNIDATVQISIEDDNGSRTLTVPLEVKTGKRVSEAHQAQTALYTLLISDRYDLDVTDGILYYLETSKTMRVKAMRHELIHMIMKRNELACYIRERLKLPPILEPNRQRLCGNCYAQTTCHLYHKLSEEGDGSLIDKKESFEKLVQPLKPIHQTFFQKWDHLITKEESEMTMFRRELWTMLSTEREHLNRCFSNVVIDPTSVSEQLSAGKINRYQYSFIKQDPSSKFSFAESQIAVGEPIVVSDELGHFALANGYVTHIHKHRVTVAVDRRLQNARRRKQGFNANSNQSFTGIMELDPTSSVAEDIEPILYRVDKDEFSNGMATVRNNMLQIMDDRVFKSADIRSLIIEGRAPKFRTVSSGWGLPSQSWEHEMNSDQKRAIAKVLSAEDYALVLGMPGTGKTTTIAQIIKCLVAKGKTVLLTSYTHTAVDNILLKIRNAGFDVLRLGVRAKVHPEVQEFAILASEPKDSLEELQDAWHKPPVVATTCLGVNHSLFSQRTFDYCIVDEASQITLPVCLGPIRMAKAFILVGDHFQLPPLVQNREALEGGLDMSLFRLLSEQHPDAVVSLEHQYRMSEDVMALANALIYSGRLKCGNEAVAKRSLALPSSEYALQTHHSTASSAISQPRICPSPSDQKCFITPILSPDTRVLFLNTDTLGNASRDSTVGNRTTNQFEASLTTSITTLLISAGLLGHNLGIVTFYRSQLSMLRQSLRSHPSVELHTADKFQGRDKEAVIVSFVRNNETGNVGDLLKDWRRINVAITRARSKLILIGSESTLSQGGDVLKGLVELCRSKRWTVDLPVNALDGHIWSSDMVGGTSSLGTQSGVRSKSTAEKRKVLGEIDRNASVKRPQKVGKVGRDAIVGSRPVLKDVMNDLV